MDCPDCHGTLGKNATYCGCGWKKGGAKGNSERLCNCGAVGIMSESVVGGGPYYCRQHWYQLKGFGGMENRIGNDLPAEHGPGVETLRRHAEMAAWLAEGNRPMIGGSLPKPEILDAVDF